MPGFYRKPTPEELLSQGDIFSDLPMIGVSLNPLIQVRPEGELFRGSTIEPNQLTEGMVLLEEINLTSAIIVSQSCDAERAPRLILAPLSDFPLEEKTATKKWKKISHAATSLAEPRTIYLPGNQTLGLPRSSANFGELFTLPREFLESVTKYGKRIASLSDQALAYFQFRLGVLLTRIAQDDYAWPSKDDLQIKLEYLKEQLADTSRKHKKKLEEAAKSEGDERLQLQVDAEEYQKELKYWESEIAKTEKALQSADEVI